MYGKYEVCPLRIRLAIIVGICSLLWALIISFAVAVVQSVPINFAVTALLLLQGQQIGDFLILFDPATPV